MANVAIRHVDKLYGQVHAVKDVSLDIQDQGSPLFFSPP